MVCAAPRQTVPLAEMVSTAALVPRCVHQNVRTGHVISRRGTVLSVKMAITWKVESVFRVVENVLSVLIPQTVLNVIKPTRAHFKDIAFENVLPTRLLSSFRTLHKDAGLH